MTVQYNFAMHRLVFATRLCAGVAAALFCLPSNAFKIDPWSYRPFGVSPRGIESQLETLIRNPRMLLLGPIAFGTRLPAAIAQLKEPVHENLTELSIRCARAPLARGDIATATATTTTTTTTTTTATAAAAATATPTATASAITGDMIIRCRGRGGELQSHAADLGEEMEELIRGVRFNDAPPIRTARALMTLVTPSALICGEVRVPENAACWALLMAHAGGLVATDPANALFRRGGNFLYRSHFGDMQFMHAMAERGETLLQSHERILLWARFTYQVAGAEITPETVIGTMPEFTSILGGFETVSVAEFFETRGGTAPERIRRIALGALLHTLQDSFADGHAERESTGTARFGPLSALRDFTCQSEDKHGAADRAANYAWFGAAVHEQDSPVTLGAQVLDMLQRRIRWNAVAASGDAQHPAAATVEQFMRATVFPIVAANAAQVASGGAQFARVKAPAAGAAASSGVISAANAEEASSAPKPADCKD